MICREEISPSSVRPCVLCVVSPSKTKGAHKGRLVSNLDDFYARGRISFRTKVGSPWLTLSGTLLLGQSRIPMAGHINPLLAGRSS